MNLHPDAAAKKSNARNLAYELSAQSISTHIDELGTNAENGKNCTLS
ncbi:hypothetical protein [Methylotenera sp.]|nr:hypothetical protein [Methylotenera sp.]MDO9204136.1 hypothetical protein [Methylotenera sp.]MDP2071738.1 hypothetical protein [Methylotenera sp.]